MKYKELYNNKKVMDIVYYEWENWMMLNKNKLIEGESTCKTFHSIMGTWVQKEDDHSKDVGKKGGLKDDDESEDVSDDDGGFHSDSGTNRSTCKWVHSENRTATTEESKMGLEKDENNNVASGGNEEGKTTAESPARNTRARKRLF